MEEEDDLSRALLYLLRRIRNIVLCSLYRNILPFLLLLPRSTFPPPRNGFPKPFIVLDRCYPRVPLYREVIAVLLSDGDRLATRSRFCHVAEPMVGFE